MSRKVKASKAQAKKLAFLWGGDRFLTITNDPAGYVDPTYRALRARGWVEVQGDQSGKASIWSITPAGVDALEIYLFHARLKRPTPPSQGKVQG